MTTAYNNVDIKLSSPSLLHCNIDVSETSSKTPYTFKYEIEHNRSFLLHAINKTHQK